MTQFFNFLGLIFSDFAFLVRKNCVNKKIAVNLYFKGLQRLPKWWAGMDSNHRSPETTDLQSVAFDRSATYPLELVIGIEPTTH